MLEAFLRRRRLPRAHVLGVGPAGSAGAAGREWVDARPSAADRRQRRGARRALEIAGRTAPGDLLLVLLSGGGSALMALPAEGVTLEDKQHTVRRLLEAGADIYELNTVRKHLSAIKGGLLAAAAPGAHAHAGGLGRRGRRPLGDRLGPDRRRPKHVRAGARGAGARGADARRFPSRWSRGSRPARPGQVPETPTAGDPRLARADAAVIGPQRGAVDGARVPRARCGFTVLVVDEPVTGEARDAAVAHVRRRGRRWCASHAAPGVRVAVRRDHGDRARHGQGAAAIRSSRCAAARHLDELGRASCCGSLGTDGIDGPTDAAGAIVDSSDLRTRRRGGIAAARGLLATTTIPTPSSTPRRPRSAPARPAPTSATCRSSWSADRALRSGCHL